MPLLEFEHKLPLFSEMMGGERSGPVRRREIENLQTESDCKI